jgi:hypothetical protein
MAGLVPAIPIIQALCPPDRDRRDEPGDDESAANPMAALRPSATARLRMACSMEIIVINTHVDRTCSGEPSIAAAFEVAYALKLSRSARAAPPTARSLPRLRDRPLRNHSFRQGRWRRTVLGGNGCRDGFLGVIEMK